eukprot:TRINITY_DN11296_c0_g1_i1.p1 TRINITY_DN11296_c0_g1~~TRINITY_DN11296_c0_g1_i1.p1  ORF type:complete len:809 (-),score=298.28 TRINITY_DN11296_c0_g1_i1:150-2576(-)
MEGKKKRKTTEEKSPEKSSKKSKGKMESAKKSEKNPSESIGTLCDSNTCVEWLNKSIEKKKGSLSLVPSLSSSPSSELLKGTFWMMCGVPFLTAVAVEDAIKNASGSVQKLMNDKVTHLLVARSVEQAPRVAASLRTKGLFLVDESEFCLFLGGKMIESNGSTEATTVAPVSSVQNGVGNNPVAGLNPIFNSNATSSPVLGNSTQKLGNSVQKLGNSVQTLGNSLPNGNSSSNSISNASNSNNVSVIPSKEEDLDMLIADKYRPKTSKDLVGNSDCISSLSSWIGSWNAESVDKRAVLLSGPPGIGKTSAASLVAVEKGYKVVEFNASDARTKNSLQEHVTELTKSRSLTEFFGAKRAEEKPKKTLLIMDEVDGMSAGDKGGMAELIQIIKKTSIPIICICNDRSSPKVKTLTGYCLDLKFKKPSVPQMMLRFKKIADSEGFNVDPKVMERMLTSVHGDMRSALNLLHLWRKSGEKLKNANNNSGSQNFSHRDIDLGPFDVAQKLISPVGAPLPLDENLALFFTDSSLVPLLIHENYAARVPNSQKVKRARVASAKAGAIAEILTCSTIMDSIGESDLFEVAVRRDQNWDLSNYHAVLSALKPCHHISGSGSSMLSLPAFLGKNSKMNKGKRQLGELHNSIQLEASCDPVEARLHYMPLLRRKITDPLIREGTAGIAQVLETMDTYGLSREDWESLIELSQLQSNADPLKDIPSATKSAFTRQYNARHHDTVRVPPKENVKNSQEEEMKEEDSTLFDREEDKENDISNDKMIVVKSADKKSSTKKSTSQETEKPAKRVKKASTTKKIK